MENPFDATYQLTKTSDNSMQVGGRVLSETGTTRKIIRAEIVRGVGETKAKFKVSLAHQRKRPGEVWEDTERVNLNSLKAGEGVRFDLDSETTARLFEELGHLEKIAQEHGIPYGWEPVEVLTLNPAQAEQARQFIAKQYPASMLRLIDAEHPELTRKLAALSQYEERSKALAAFESSLTAGLKEDYWADFFSKNSWIFGYGLSYQVLGVLQKQAYYGGKDQTNQGGQKGDALQATVANVRFTSLLDIKTPDAPLLEQEYRNGCWSVSSELAGGVAQLQGNCLTWASEGSMRPETAIELSKKSIFTVQPEGILVIGNTNELKDDDAKRKSFELFRQNLSNPKVMTFDELYERASFILGAKPEDLA